ncbi:FAS-associated factor 1-like [Artemia franciscana]|uniref:UBX domain-containing protein n=1 Tax=Artemia franciscana TaxID=6661 RepID=A0AA88INA0_ARTSF|nr:hypothetical protein QYM36_001353 [Artemia franciscana]
MNEESSREEILANFQACSGIEDIGEAFMHLEETNWNLLEALQRVLPETSQNFVSPPVEVVNSPDVEFIEETPLLHPLPSAPYLPPRFFPADIGPDLNTPRALDIAVIGSYKTFNFILSEEETLGKLKNLISIKAGIPGCQISLTGWPDDNVPQSDSVKLRSLNLPQKTTLYMISPIEPVLPNTDEIAQRLSLNYRLIIHDDTNKKVHQIPFPGTKTILEVKQDTNHLTDIPVRCQDWKGWPPEATDDAALGVCGIDYPEHILHVTKNLGNRSRNGEGSSYAEPIIVDTDEEEEFEDANDFGVDEETYEVRTRPAHQSILPPDAVDSLPTAVLFSENFSARYGESHPMFYQGSLEEALKESLLVSAKNRKPLIVYVHSDKSILANVFCSQVLCSEAVVSYISSNFNIWGWDITHESNRQRLIDMIAEYFDSSTAHAIKLVDVERLPLLLVANKIRSTFDNISMIQGSVTLEEMMTTLMHVHEQFNWQQAADIEEERAREEREIIKREQEEAYNASLLADRAKEEAKKQELEEKLKVEKEEKRKVEMEARQRQQSEQDKQRRQEEVSATLPSEPPPGADVTAIRFRLPDGKQVTRRFSSIGPLKTMFDFLFVQGFSTSEYKVLQTFPRRDLSGLDPTQSLKELGLSAQETLIIEER